MQLGVGAQRKTSGQRGGEHRHLLGLELLIEGVRHAALHLSIFIKFISSSENSSRADDSIDHGHNKL